jgi:hypothetical protein
LFSTVIPRAKHILLRYGLGSEHLLLHDIEEVDQWENALRRHDGLVALGRLQRTEPLFEALEIPADNDTKYQVRRLDRGRSGGWRGRAADVVP